MDSALAQHPPALKVGGRRLSTSQKHPKSGVSHESAKEKDDADPSEPPDYPRPAAPPSSSDDTSPKKDKDTHKDKDKDRDIHNTHKNRERETGYLTKPTFEDVKGGRKADGVRIVQPAGKSLGS